MGQSEGHIRTYKISTNQNVWEHLMQYLEGKGERSQINELILHLKKS